MYARSVAVGSLLLMGLSACSSNILKGPDPVCGAPIDRGAVMVLDMTGFEQRQDQIARAVQEKAGSYHLMTDKPVWIPKQGSSRKSRSPASIVHVQSIAADWGCNLLILLDSKMARTEVRTQSRNEDVIWLVQAGMRGAP